MWHSVCASTGGVVAAAFAALEDGVAGSLSSGLHHARREEGRGFCTFNGLALAAELVTRSRPGAVLVVDLDAHCGGGTASITARSSRIHQLDVAVNRFDIYSSATPRQSLDVVSAAGEYLDTVQRRLDGIDLGLGFDLVLYNAGMDPYEGCDIGGLRGVTERLIAERERMVFGWAREHGLPIAFVLAGGYIGARLSESTLVGLHRLTIKTAATHTGSLVG